jgi:hypothetical protein
MYWWIKIWTNHWKLTYRWYWDIIILPKQ